MIMVCGALYDLKSSLQGPGRVGRVGGVEIKVRDFPKPKKVSPRDH